MPGSSRQPSTPHCCNHFPSLRPAPSHDPVAAFPGTLRRQARAVSNTSTSTTRLVVGSVWLDGCVVWVRTARLACALHAVLRTWPRLNRRPEVGTPACDRLQPNPSHQPVNDEAEQSLFLFGFSGRMTEETSCPPLQSECRHAPPSTAVSLPSFFARPTPFRLRQCRESLDSRDASIGLQSPRNGPTRQVSQQGLVHALRKHRWFCRLPHHTLSESADLC